MKSRLCTRHSEGTMFLQDVVIELGNRGVRSPSSSSSGPSLRTERELHRKFTPPGATPERSFSRCPTRPGSQGCGRLRKLRPTRRDYG